jgi:phage terminase large subunit-like protein
MVKKATALKATPQAKQPKAPTSALANLDEKTLKAMLKQLQAEASKEGMRLYKPYPKQMEFHNATKGHREICLAGGNQIGKTWAAANGLAIWLTGEYPDWWQGRVFDHPVNAWAIGLTSEATRDTLQRLLMGRPGEFGTGAIPADCIVSYTSARGVSDALDTVVVKNKYGGNSTLGFRSAARGREALQGESLHIVQADEEGPLDVYTELLTRTQARNGLVAMTFTPLLGMSDVVKRFFMEKNPDRKLVNATIDDAYHYTPEQRASIIAGYPAHEREARAKGIPVLGSGRVYPVDEDLYVCDPFPLGKHLPRLGAIDFGISHPTAVVLGAHDRDTDTIIIYDTLRVKDTSVVLQAPIIAAKARYPGGAAIPIAYPHDGDNREKGSGHTLADQYRDLGVNMLPEPVKHADGGNSVEAGISDVLNRMQTGRLKIFSNNAELLEELRMYHRKNGLIHKVDEDLADAMRYLVMGIRYACNEPRSIGGQVHHINFGVRRGGY